MPTYIFKITMAEEADTPEDAWSLAMEDLSHVVSHGFMSDFEIEGEEIQ
ncbi:MAG: hypothetical protein WC291_09875 [Thermodesulfovibrionales bacterium]|jgi:hypothetical protein